MDLAQLWPPFGVRLTCGPLDLRTLRDDDIPDLVDLALAGVEAEGVEVMPFENPWHREDAAGLPASMARFYWGTRSRFTPEAWSLTLVVRRDGRVVGAQDVVGREFAKTGSLETGSWLGRAHHRQGTGTLMRQMVAAFGFEHLGAEELTSSFYEGNVASQGVSARVGYVEAGRRRAPREHGWSWKHEVVLTPERFVRPCEPVVAEGVAAFRRFIGLE